MQSREHLNIILSYYPEGITPFIPYLIAIRYSCNPKIPITDVFQTSFEIIVDSQTFIRHNKERPYVLFTQPPILMVNLV